MSRTGRWGELEGGLDTTRLTAAEQDRIAREALQADALAFFTRRDMAGPGGVAEILGLTPPTCLICQRPTGKAKGWFCDREYCRSPRVRRPILARLNESKES